MTEARGTYGDLSSRWILDFEKQIERRKHVLLYGNIHDQFLWRGEYLTVAEFLPAYFGNLRFDLVVRYDSIDGFQFADDPLVVRGRPAEQKLPDGMRRRFESIVRHGVIERNPGLAARPSALAAPGGGATGSQSVYPPLAPSGTQGAAAGSQLVYPPSAATGAPGAPTGSQSTHSTLGPSSTAGANGGSAAHSPVVDATAPPPRQGPGATVGVAPGRRVSPEEAFGNLRLLLGQSGVSTAAIVDLGDMLTSEAQRYTSCELAQVMLLKKAALEATVIRNGPLIGYRNTLVVTAGDLQRVPNWFYRENPFVALVQAARPNKEERRQFAIRFIRPGPDSGGFFGGDQVSDAAGDGQEYTDLASVADEFADLTEGFQAMDLEALRHTSWREEIPVRHNEVWRLVDFFKFGVRQDPWEQLKPEKVQRARTELSKTVIGQPVAIEAVTTMLTAARVGLSIGGNSTGRTGKPKGIFFFVGPTGVGKTELAKAVTKLVFGDEGAFARFDMSEYKEEHAAEKLAGAPPGFMGYEDGGQLTNRVIEQPYSILLFDEIEKAHPRVLDKFLQILEDGRLTDGKGQTAYFNQTAIIFTSNIGASDLTDAQTGIRLREGIMNRVQLSTMHEFSYEQVAAHFRAEVDWYFTSRIGRAELLSRLGDNIVVFDLLRPAFVQAIGQKFLDKLAVASMEKYRLTLEYRPSVLSVLAERMAQKDNLLFGGRRIKSLLETLVERPLNGWIFERVPKLDLLAGRTLEVGLTPDGRLEVCDV